MSLTVSCPQCQSPSDFYYESIDKNHRFSNDSFRYYRCPICRLIFIDPIPEFLDDYYRNEYYHTPESVDQILPAVELNRYKIEMIKPFVPEGQVLEIGPGNGDFVYLAQESGYDVTVIEMNPLCCSFIEKQLKATVINGGNIVQSLKPMPDFDVIALWHVIEHLPHPWEALDTLVSHVKENGVLVIAAPNPDSIQFRLFGTDWVHLDPPRHLELIPAEILIRRIELLGMNLVLKTSSDPGGRFWDDFGWEKSLNFLEKYDSLEKHPDDLRDHLLQGLAIQRDLIRQWNMPDSTYTLVFQKVTQEQESVNKKYIDIQQQYATLHQEYLGIKSTLDHIKTELGIELQDNGAYHLPWHFFWVQRIKKAYWILIRQGPFALGKSFLQWLRK